MTNLSIDFVFLYLGPVNTGVSRFISLLPCVETKGFLDCRMPGFHGDDASVRYSEIKLIQYRRKAQISYVPVNIMILCKLFTIIFPQYADSHQIPDARGCLTGDAELQRLGCIRPPWLLSSTWGVT